MFGWEEVLSEPSARAARTIGMCSHGKERVLARLGRAGEMVRAVTVTPATLRPIDNVLVLERDKEEKI